MEKYVAVADHSEKGFAPVWICNDWRIAISNDGPASHAENITNISKHTETDETFTLITGKADLYYGDGCDTPGTVRKVPMEIGKTLVVKAGTWHFTITEESAKILIAENADTGDKNTVKYPFTFNDFK